jgi:hypothetical protein
MKGLNVFHNFLKEFSVKLFGLVSIVSLSCLSVSCGEDNKKSSSTTPSPATTVVTELKFADVQTTTENCKSCHMVVSANYGNVKLVTVDDWKANKAKALSEVEAGTMPQSGSIVNTAEGKKMIEWLKGGTDLQ